MLILTRKRGLVVNDIETFLNQLASRLSISESKFEEAEKSYKAVGTFLSAEDSELSMYSPEIYPQGSFAQGTVIRPLSDDDDFDLDLVCELKILRKSLSQSQLKKIVGDRFKGSDRYKKLLQPEGNRCWTLKYAEASRFHMDILPSVPEQLDIVEDLQRANVPMEIASTAIAITCKRHHSYQVKGGEWPSSNPRGYLKWFRSRMAVMFEQRRRALAESLSRGVDDIPEYRVVTPLQSAIKILKRHRDSMFAEAPDISPISIIITTLAARAYKNTETITQSMNDILVYMNGFVSQGRGKKVSVLNPVNPKENFADKWEANSELREAFENWVVRVTADFKSLLDEAHSPNQMDIFRRTLVQNAEASPLSGSLQQVQNHFVGNPVNAPHREKPSWSLARSKNIELYCEAGKADGFRSGGVKSNSNALSKGQSLDFTLQGSFRDGDEVFWQVTNTGPDAKGNLRGGFELGVISNGLSRKRENTLYKGKHSVQAFHVRDGDCIGKSQLFIVNII